MQIDRRHLIVGMGALALAGPALAAQPTSPFRMWHSPGCGCCLQWAKHVEAAFGRKLEIIEAADMAAVKRAGLVPEDLQSCHTALIGNAIIEGHVPAAEIKRLLAGGNDRRLGLAVPGMPAGSPGMEVGRSQPYRVYAFGRDGARTVYASYPKGG